MTDFKKIRSHCLLVLALCSGSAAHAGPAYRVNVDTGAYNGQALMDFTFLANDGAAQAKAVLSNFSGAFGAEFERAPGVAGALPGALTMDNQNGGSYLTQFVTLGGILSFDVRFDGDFASSPNLNATQFNATLYDSSFSDYIGIAGSFASFDLLPPSNGTQGQVLVSAPNTLAAVSAIPEPSSLLLLLGPLAMLGLSRRTRRR